MVKKKVVKRVVRKLKTPELTEPMENLRKHLAK